MNPPDFRVYDVLNCYHIAVTEADLRIECMGDITTLFAKDRGKFLSSVTVRCLNFPEDDR